MAVASRGNSGVAYEITLPFKQAQQESQAREHVLWSLALKIKPVQPNRYLEVSSLHLAPTHI